VAERRRPAARPRRSRRADPPPLQRPRGLDNSLVGIGVGLAATGVGALLGLAAERIAIARRFDADDPADGDGRGGPPLGSLRGEAHVVVSDDVPLHVEIDERDDDRPDADRSGITVVMSHGYALTLDSWHYQRLALRGRYRLVLWDQRGHGRSGTGPPGSSTIDQVGADLAAVIEHVAPEGPLVLLGHSMGGMTVMSLAALHPEWFAERVEAVALISTSAGGESGVTLGFGGVTRLVARAAPNAARLAARAPGLTTRGRQLTSDLESLLVRRYSFGSPVPPQLVAFSARMIHETRVEVISDYLPTFGTHDKRTALAAMADHDVLLIVGDHDVMTPVAATEQIAALLPNAEQIVVADAGHLLPLEHPELVTGPVEALLDRAAEAVQSSGRPTRRRGWVRRTVTPVRERWPRPGARRRRRHGGTGEPA
jgi:pimeloyl-ACP methyl ester carboxylesterase